MPKVSVVVPIYGVEKYIERCARSLFEQTLDDMEFVFVDDCTKDDSIAVLEKVIENYPQRKSQIRILHHEINKGLPQARKTGVGVTTGEYIAHCDSDDWTDTDMYREMYEKAKENDADVVICDYYKHNGKQILQTVEGCRQLLLDSVRDELMTNGKWSVWNKLFKHSLYSDDVIYPQGNMGEDLALVFQLLLRCNKVSFITTPLYYYFQNPTSISNIKTKTSVLKKYEQLNGNMTIMFNEYKRFDRLESIEAPSFFMKWDLRRLIWGLVHERKYYALWKNTYPEVDKQILFSSQVSFSEKIRYVLTRLKLYPFKKDRIVE